MKNKWPIFVISLPDALVRQQLMRSQLSALGIENIVFLSAVRGAEISVSEKIRIYNDSHVRAHAGRSMTVGELGCALSHLKCYDYIASSDAEWSVVLEDDAVLPSNFVETIDDLISKSALFGASIFSLGPIRKFIKDPAFKVSEKYDVVTPIRIWNAHAYLINREAAGELVRINRPVSYMADDWMSFQRETGLVVRGIDPYLCYQYEETKEAGLEIDRKIARKQRHFDLSIIFYWRNLLLRRLAEIMKARGMKLHRH